ncbi:MAG TPA: hypothetical protein VI957_01735 [Candidatus Paceibacterota bacterium]
MSQPGTRAEKPEQTKAVKNLIAKYNLLVRVRDLPRTPKEEKDLDTLVDDLEKDFENLSLYEVNQLSEKILNYLRKV